MSKIGKKPISIPENVKTDITERNISIEGVKGKSEKQFPSEISVEKKDRQLFIKFSGPKEKKALFGTWRAHIKNMIEGVTQGFEKKLKIEGLGWRANLEGKNLVLKVGLTHPVKISPSEGIVFSVKKEIITISGIDKEKVGSTAMRIRNIQPPEPYKGKGIRYIDEIIRIKAGKKAAATVK